jgi:hypothetical protein
MNIWDEINFYVFQDRYCHHADKFPVRYPIDSQTGNLFSILHNEIISI